MSRPSAEEIAGALALVHALAEVQARKVGAEKDRAAAAKVLLRALEPRPVWPAKEVAEALSVDGYRVASSNLNSVRGLPAPAQTLPRPTATQPENTLRLWYADEIEAFVVERRAKREGTGT